VRCRSARKKSGLGQPLGNKDEGCGRRVHQHQGRDNRCLMIYDRSGELGTELDPEMAVCQTR
jgi:hypothetical protein